MTNFSFMPERITPSLLEAVRIIVENNKPTHIVVRKPTNGSHSTEEAYLGQFGFYVDPRKAIRLTETQAKLAAKKWNDVLETQGNKEVIHDIQLISEKWNNDYETPENKKGMWDGWSLADLHKEANKLRSKENHTAAESKRLKEVDFAIRAKTGWGKANEDISFDEIDAIVEGKVQGPKNLSVSEKHQLKIAKDTLKMHDAIAKVMGGPSKEEARNIIKKLTGKTIKEDVPLTPEQQQLLINQQSGHNVIPDGHRGEMINHQFPEQKNIEENTNPLKKIILDMKENVKFDRKFLSLMAEEVIIEKTEESHDDADDAEAKVNIINQLRKVIDSGGKHFVKFEGGKKGKISVEDAEKLLKMHGKLKPAHKLMMQDYLIKSPQHLKKIACSA